MEQTIGKIELFENIYKQVEYYYLDEKKSTYIFTNETSIQSGFICESTSQ